MSDAAVSNSSQGQTPGDTGAFFSYGFRPFFLGAAAFAGVAPAAWVALMSSAADPNALTAARQWHVHGMLFGFLPAVITGFLLTAIPNWTDRPPIVGRALRNLFLLWIAGRLLTTIPWFPVPPASAVVDALFLVAVAGMVWREIGAAGSWSHAPVAVILSLYACAGIAFHGLHLNGLPTDIAERSALGLIMVLLTVIGGRLTPTFTEEFVTERRIAVEPAGFSALDRVSIALALFGSCAWVLAPDAQPTGWLVMSAGFVNLGRVARWRGWVTWREPLVLILHVGYAWLALAMLAIGAAALGIGLPRAEAVHALTTGAVGAMTLAVMTRASLGHTGHVRHAGPATVLIYVLVNAGAAVRVVGPITAVPELVGLAVAVLCWSGAYLLFAAVYGPLLVRPSRDE